MAKMKTQISERQKRELFVAFDKDSAVIDVEKRTLTMPVSSEAPVVNWWGDTEILVHSAESVDLTRMLAAAPLLADHNREAQIGVIESAEIRDGKLYVTAKFSKRGKGDDVFADVCDGIRRNVSIGYVIEKYEYDELKEILTVTRWTPYEVSIVSVPADTTVGVGRSMPDGSGSQGENQAGSPGSGGENKDNIDSARGAENNPKKSNERQSKMNENEVKEILALGKRFGMLSEASEHVSGGKDLASFRALVDEAHERAMAAKTVNVSTATAKRDAAVNAEGAPTLSGMIRAAMGEASDRKAMERGFAVSEELYKMSPNIQRSPGMSFMFRDFSGAVGGDGAALIGTDHRGDLFVNMLRSNLAIQPTLITGLRGNVSIPRQIGKSTVDFVPEITSPGTETNPVFNALNLSPRRISAVIDIPKDLIMQSSPSAELLVQNDIAYGFAERIEATCLRGRASNPTVYGVGNTTGVNTVGIDIATVTWKEMLGFGKFIYGKRNALGGKFVMSAADFQDLKGTEKSTGSARYICEDGKIDGFEVAVSGELATGEIYLGNFADVMVGMWGVGLEITVDPFTKANQGIVRVVVNSLIDVGVRTPNGFVKSVAK